MNEENISFSAAEVNLIASLLSHAYHSWNEILEKRELPEDHTIEDCEAIVAIISEALEKFIIISEDISKIIISEDISKEEDETEVEGDIPNNVIKFPNKK